MLHAVLDLCDDLRRQDIEIAAVLPEKVGKVRDLIARLIDDEVFFVGKRAPGIQRVADPDREHGVIFHKDGAHDVRADVTLIAQPEIGHKLVHARVDVVLDRLIDRFVARLGIGDVKFAVPPAESPVPEIDGGDRRAEHGDVLERAHGGGHAVEGQ